MTRASNQSNTAADILKGIANASVTFYKLTNGVWLDYAPEYFITVEIARILGSDSTPISL
jgi:hypothetical protein